MDEELFTNIPSKVGDLINDVKNGRIRFPDLQHPLYGGKTKTDDRDHTQSI